MLLAAPIAEVTSDLVAAGDLVEHQRPLGEMPLGEPFLDRSLPLQEPARGLVKVILGSEATSSSSTEVVVSVHSLAAKMNRHCFIRTATRQIDSSEPSSSLRAAARSDQT
jgi:hypothetical protein